MNVSATHPVEELGHFLGKGDLLPLDKEDPLVLQGAGPVHVDLELAPDILGDHEQLGEALANIYCEIECLVSLAGYERELFIQ